MIWVTYRRGTFSGGKNTLAEGGIPWGDTLEDRCLRGELSCRVDGHRE